MKKVVIISSLAIFAFTANTVKAQAFEEGKKIVTVGYGFPNLPKILLKAAGDASSSSGYTYSATGIGPIHGRFEYGLTDRYGIGLSINYNSYGYDETYNTTSSVYNSTTGTYTDVTTTTTNTLRVNSINFLIRGNKHWDINDKVDIFSGFGLGYNNTKAKYTSTDPNSTTNASTWNSLIPIGFEYTIGMRYYFTPNIGIYIEGGYAKSLLQGGFAAKF